MVSFLITLLIVLYRIPLINILGDKGMGYYSIALSVYLLFMTVIAYGLPKSVSKLVSIYFSKGEYKHVYKTIQSSLVFSILIGAVCSLFIYFSAEIIATHLLNSSNSVYAIRAFAPCLLFVTLAGSLHGIFAGTNRVSLSQTAYKIEEFFVAIFSISGVWFFTQSGTSLSTANNDLSLIAAYGSMGAAIGITAGVFVSCIFLLVLFRKHNKKLKNLSDKDTKQVKDNKRKIIRKIYITMIPFIITLVIFHLSSIVDYAIFNYTMRVQGYKENSYIILLGMLNGKYEFFISIPLLLVHWFVSSHTGIFSRIVDTDNHRKINSKINQYLRYTMLSIMPCVIYYILYSKPLMDTLFTDNNTMPAILLRVGAVSVIFYALAAITNSFLNSLNDWSSVAKNSMIALVVQSIGLLIMMIILQWGIIAVVLSRVLFSFTLFVLNEHLLREHTGYVQEPKRVIHIPLIAGLILGIFTFIIYLIIGIFFADCFAAIFAIILGLPVYIMAIILLGGVTQREMYRIPGGKTLAPLCRKLHLIK